MPNKRIQKSQNTWAMIVGAVLGLMLGRACMSTWDAQLEAYKLCVGQCENRTGRMAEADCRCQMEQTMKDFLFLCLQIVIMIPLSVMSMVITLGLMYRVGSYFFDAKPKKEGKK